MTAENRDANRRAQTDISVVVGSVESERSIVDCLNSIQSSAGGRRIEVIVVDASNDGTAGLVRLEFPDVALVSMPRGTLTPLLWAEGLAHSHGRAVAFTTGHCTVSESWLSDLEGSLKAGAVGAGGPIALRAGASLLDAAIYFLRYSAFMPAQVLTPHPTPEIAGDNALYSRDALASHAESLTEGLWEIRLNSVLRKEGRYLEMVPTAVVYFGHSFPLAVISRHRVAHGIHSGKWRVREGILDPWRIVLGAPLVPFVLLVRILGRVGRVGGDRALVVKCSPFILWLAACWALGEARGAWEARGARRD